MTDATLRVIAIVPDELESSGAARAAAACSSALFGAVAGLTVISIWSPCSPCLRR